MNGDPLGGLARVWIFHRTWHWWKQWRRSRTHYPPAPEPDRERVGSLASDGTPCRGWPSREEE